jgi:hypothetical protein
MKIAVLYSGMPVFDEELLLSHKKYIWDNYHTDLYLSTYSQAIDIDDKHDIDKILSFAFFKTIDVENLNDVVSNHLAPIDRNIKIKAPETKTTNTLSMFYKINKCFSLIEPGYDIVIRSRLDIRVDSPLEFDYNEGVHVPCGGDHRGGLLDLFAYGSYNSMKTYTQLFQYLNEYIKDKQMCLFHPETLLRFHCNYNRLPIHRFNYNIYLRDILFNNTHPCIT